MIVGICSIGSYVPKRRISIHKVLKVWKNSNEDFIRNVIGCSERAVTSSDEDSITIASEAIRKMIGNKNGSLHAEAIYLGSSTLPDKFRSNALSLMDTFTANNDLLVQDIQASENSGVLSIINAFGLIKSNLVNEVFVVGVDTISNHIAPGSIREAYSGCGGSALSLGRKNVICELKGFSYSSSSFPEKLRPEDERFIRDMISPSSDVIIQGMVSRCEETVLKLLKKEKININEFKYIVMPQNSMIGVKLLCNRLEIKETQIHSSMYFHSTGDIGSAGSILGLDLVLEKANPNDKILVISYGSSSQAVVLYFKATDLITQYKKDTKFTVSSLLLSTIPIEYSEMLKIEDKIIQPNQPFGPFM